MNTITANDLKDGTCPAINFIGDVAFVGGLGIVECPSIQCTGSLTAGLSKLVSLLKLAGLSELASLSELEDLLPKAAHPHLLEKK